MKGFIIVICIFSLMLGGIAFGKIKIEESTDELLTQVKALQNHAPNAKEIIGSVQQKWDRCKDIIQISATHKRIENVTDLIDTLTTYIEHQSNAAWQKTAELLINALEELKQFEEFSAVNIL